MLDDNSVVLLVDIHSARHAAQIAMSAMPSIWPQTGPRPLSKLSLTSNDEFVCITTVERVSDDIDSSFGDDFVPLTFANYVKVLGVYGISKHYEITVDAVMFYHCLSAMVEDELGDAIVLVIGADGLWVCTQSSYVLLQSVSAYVRGSYPDLDTEFYINGLSFTDALDAVLWVRDDLWQPCDIFVDVLSGDQVSFRSVSDRCGSVCIVCPDVRYRRDKSCVIPHSAVRMLANILSVLADANITFGWGDGQWYCDIEAPLWASSYGSRICSVTGSTLESDICCAHSRIPADMLWTHRLARYDVSAPRLLSALSIVKSVATNNYNELTIGFDESAQKVFVKATTNAHMVRSSAVVHVDTSSRERGEEQRLDKHETRTCSPQQLDGGTYSATMIRNALQPLYSDEKLGISWNDDDTLLLQSDRAIQCFVFIKPCEEH